MFKRKSNDNAPEGAPATKEVKVEPIPRVLPENTITLNFVCRGWEEIAPGYLYYLPLCQTPKYMFDTAMVNQFKKFEDLWETMEIINPQARISNLIMLQDDLRVQSSTPTDATAFTQVVYLLKYCPRGQKQYFKLANVKDKSKMEETITLTYKLYPEKSTRNNQLTKIDGFESFDQLAILPAKANEEAGFVPYQSFDVISGTNVIASPYISPNAPSILNHLSGNMKPLDNTVNFQSPTNVLTMCQNQDKIDFYKYGDTFDIPITTNLDGVKLANKRRNDFLVETQAEVTLTGGGKIAYGTEWVYPSRNRPFLHRGNYYDANTDPIMQGKKLKSLNHCFICMPPIRKPGGELLGQRCSMFVEQSVTIRFHCSQAIFDNSDDNDNELQVNQDNQVLLRRNFYPTPLPITNEGPLCPSGSSCKVFNEKKRKNKADKPCYENTWAGFNKFIGTLNDDEMLSIFYASKTYPTMEGIREVSEELFTRTCSSTSDTCFGLNAGNTYADYGPDEYFEKEWRLSLIEGTGFFCPITLPIFNDNLFAVLYREGQQYWNYTIDKDQVKEYKYFIFDVQAFSKLLSEKSNTVCNVYSNADPAFDKTCNVFFC